MLRAIANYCEGCQRIGETRLMPYTVTISLAPSGTVVRRFCSRACLGYWAEQEKTILRCPDCHGTGWAFGFQSNGTCAACAGEGTRTYPAIYTVSQEKAKRNLRTALIARGCADEKIDEQVEREFRLTCLPNLDETDHAEDERPETRTDFPVKR